MATQYVCDRCSTVHTRDNLWQVDVASDSLAVVGTMASGPETFEVCESCRAELLDWLRTAPGATVQPPTTQSP
jgi:hypothetical protein